MRFEEKPVRESVRSVSGRPRGSGLASGSEARGKGIGTLSAALVAAAVLALAMVRGPEARTTAGGGSGADPVMILAGPNDGEPINCRTLSRELRTDYIEPATIVVCLNGAYCFSRPLFENASVDPASGLLTTPIEVDLADTDATNPLRASSGSAAQEIRLSVYLYDDLTAEFVGAADWIGYVLRPSLEVLVPGSGAAPGIAVPEGKIAFRIRPLEVDLNALIFAASSPEVLRSSPEDPALFREARVLAGGNLTGSPGGPDAVFLERTALPETAFAVLWTYDPAGGWKSSAVVRIPKL